MTDLRCTSCHGPLRPVVAVDVDGTLADYHLHFWHFLEQYLGRPVVPITGSKFWTGRGEFSDWLQVDKSTYQTAKLAFRSGGFKRWMPAFEGAMEFTHALTRMGAEVWITTTRPWMRMDNIDPDTKDWLLRNNIAYDYLMFEEDKYAHLIDRVGFERIVAIVDDQADQMRRCEALDLPFILRKTNYNQAIHHSVEVVSLSAAQQVIGQRISEWKDRHDV